MRLVHVASGVDACHTDSYGLEKIFVLVTAAAFRTCSPGIFNMWDFTSFDDLLDFLDNEDFSDWCGEDSMRLIGTRIRCFESGDVN